MLEIMTQSHDNVIGVQGRGKVTNREFARGIPDPGLRKRS